MNLPTMIDAFSGAGGLSVGFREFFFPVMGIEWSRTASWTYKSNHPQTDVKNESIIDVLNGPIPENIDILVGGPPCQGFSLANPSPNRPVDERRAMWRYFLEMAERCNAKAFVMENVNILMSTNEFKQIKSAAEAMGFNLVWSILNAANYGAPTTRRRFFMVGKKGKIKSEWPPKETHKRAHKSGFDMDLFGEYLPWVTLREAIGDLPVEAKPENKYLSAPLNLHYPCHSPENDPFIGYVPPEGSWADVDRTKIAHEDPIRIALIDKYYKYMTGYSRKKWDEPCNTLMTVFTSLPAQNRSGHPTENRTLTLREGARVQSFPDDYIFCGKEGPIAKQIGNSVSVKVAEVVAKWLYNELYNT